MTKRNRGRPKNPATIERQATERWLYNLPKHCKLIPEESFTKEWSESTERVRQQILSDYKHDATVPDYHAYEMASLGDESMFGFEKGIMERGQFYRARCKENRASGTLRNSQKSMEKARWLCEDNSDLLERMETPNGPSLNSIVTMIVDHWDERGVTEEPPSKRTLTRWINKFRQAS